MKWKHLYGAMACTGPLGGETVHQWYEPDPCSLTNKRLRRENKIRERFHIRAESMRSWAEQPALAMQLIITMQAKEPVVRTYRALCGVSIASLYTYVDPLRTRRPMCDECELRYGDIRAGAFGRENQIDRHTYLYPNDVERYATRLADILFETRLKVLEREGLVEFPRDFYGDPANALPTERLFRAWKGSPFKFTYYRPRLFGDAMYPFAQRMSELARQHGMNPPPLGEWLFEDSIAWRKANDVQVEPST